MTSNLAKDELVKAMKAAKTGVMNIHYRLSCELGDAVVATLAAQPALPVGLTREEGGRVVRQAWLKWLANNPSASGKRPASWSVKWDNLKEEDKEVDRQIFDAVRKALKAVESPP